MEIGVVVCQNGSDALFSSSQATESDMVPYCTSLDTEKTMFVEKSIQLNWVLMEVCSIWAAAVLGTQKGWESVVDSFVLEIDRCS